MQYSYLKKWVEENKQQNLYVKAILKFEDQYLMIFKSQHRNLQINLANDSFCFFCERRELPFRERSELNLFQQNLSNARLTEITISPDDRILFFRFERIDIYNQKQKMQLVLELIPRYKNLILMQNCVIVDCLRKISFAENRHRQILPGVEYHSPVTDFKIEEKEISYPLIIDEKLKLTHSPIGIFQNMNSTFEALYYDGLLKRKLQLKKDQKIRTLQKDLKKKEKKQKKLQQELQDASKEIILKQQAELLKANFDKLKPGMQEIILTNYYHEEFPELMLKLDETKSARQNVENYFKKYRKARDGKSAISRQIALTELEINDLHKKINEIEKQDHPFVEEQKQSRRSTSKRESFKKLKVDENWEIYIGRSSKENDYLTSKFAKPYDWWFHTRIFRGTHVILRNLNKKELPEKLMLICCRLAAYYSKAKKSGNIPVDYTQIRFVRKPHGSAPGFVVYRNQKTMFVDPLSQREAARLLAEGKQ